MEEKPDSVVQPNLEVAQLMGYVSPSLFLHVNFLAMSPPVPRTANRHLRTWAGTLHTQRTSRANVTPALRKL